jgi:uncharacterized protein YutE (UPF0331/DUF86 family)
MLKEKIKRLEENLVTLEEFRKNTSLDDLLRDKIKQWALKYGILDCIQEIIDISCVLVSSNNLGNPKNYRECVEILIKNGYISEELGKRLISMVGLRNLLVHEYIKIDLSRLYEFLNNLNDFREFIYYIGLKDESD